MSGELRDAIAILRQRRAEAVSLVEKYDNAIRVLEDLDGNTGDRAPAVAFGSAHLRLSRPSPASRRSVKQRVLTLLNRDPAATWTTKRIIDAFERQGDPLEAKDVENAVRTALSEAVKDELVLRIAPGEYRSARPVAAGPSPHEGSEDDLAPSAQPGP